jgi:hypothetical protein
VIYEVKFDPHAGDENGAGADVAAYLDAILGKAMWVCLKTQAGPASEATDLQAVILICPAPSLLALKWADILYSHRRVIEVRRLTVYERELYRTTFGGRFPWE